MSDQSYHQILKSTTIIGGSSAVNIAIRIVASKLAALILGPAGVGLIGVFNSITGVASTISGMGLASSSGVRQMSEAYASGDREKMAHVALILRRLSFLLGIGGSVSFFLLRVPISQLTFGNFTYAAALGLLAPAVGFNVISGMQMAFLRGVRRVGDMARAQVLGMALGAFLGLPALYLWGLAGVAPYLLILAGISLGVSGYYVRRIDLPRGVLSWRQTFRAARSILILGAAFMFAGLTTMATTYLVKILITRQMGLQAAGLYEAASALSNVYVGFILGAMGADFFPHLTSVSEDKGKSAALMNAQVEVGLLAAAPGILAVLALGTYLLTVLYSSAFTPAFEILRWQALGTFLRVVSWPLGYIILAKGKGGWFFLSELSANLVYLSLLWLLVPRWGLTGVGLAFFGMYLYHSVLMSIFAKWLTDFRFSKRNLSLGLLFAPCLLAALLASLWLPSGYALLFNLALTVITGVISARSFYRMLGQEAIRRYLNRFRQKLGWKNL